MRVSLATTEELEKLDNRVGQVNHALGGPRGFVSEHVNNVAFNPKCPRLCIVAGWGENGVPD